jgi:hypothetical protein
MMLHNIETQDDVPEAVKLARLQEVISTYRAALINSMSAEIGRTHLVSFHSCKLCLLFALGSLQRSLCTGCASSLTARSICLLQLDSAPQLEITSAAGACRGTLEAGCQQPDGAH